MWEGSVVMKIIEGIVFIAIIIMFVIWPFYYIFNVALFYLKIIVSGAIMVVISLARFLFKRIMFLEKKTEDYIIIINEKAIIKKIKKWIIIEKVKSPYKFEKFDAIFNTPFYLYTTLVFLTIYFSNIIDLFTRTSSFNLKLDVRFLILVQIICLLNYIGVILLYRFYYISSDWKEQKIRIISSLKMHKSFIKTSFMPVVLISITASILTIINQILVTEKRETLQKIFLEIIESIELSSLTLIVVIFAMLTLVYMAINYFILTLLIHFVEEKDRYLFFPKVILKFYLRL